MGGFLLESAILGAGLAMDAFSASLAIRPLMTRATSSRSPLLMRSIFSR